MERVAVVAGVPAGVPARGSVLDADTGAPITTWPIAGSASPDMGGVTADGSQLWLSGRYDDEVHVMSTVDGHTIARIPVGHGPHGLCVWPQPGRCSLGGTGVTRRPDPARGHPGGGRVVTGLDTCG